MARLPDSTPTAATTTEIGRAAESRALRHLETAGLVLLTRNYRCRAGEIDLVAKAAEKAGALLDKIARQPLESLGAGLRNALAAITGIDPAAMGTAVGIGMYAAVLASLCTATWLLRPQRRKVVYV